MIHFIISLTDFAVSARASSRARLMSVFVVPAEGINHIKSESVHSIGERTKPRSKSNVPPFDIDFIGASIDNLLFLHGDWQTGPSFGWNICEFYLAISGEGLLVGFNRF